MNGTTVLTLDTPGADEALHRVYRMLAKWAREAERTADPDTVGSQPRGGGTTSAPSQRQGVTENEVNR